MKEKIIDRRIISINGTECEVTFYYQFKKNPLGWRQEIVAKTIYNGIPYEGHAHIQNFDMPTENERDAAIFALKQVIRNSARK